MQESVIQAAAQFQEQEIRSSYEMTGQQIARCRCACLKRMERRRKRGTRHLRPCVAVMGFRACFQRNRLGNGVMCAAESHCPGWKLTMRRIWNVARVILILVCVRQLALGWLDSVQADRMISEMRRPVAGPENRAIMFDHLDPIQVILKRNQSAWPNWLIALTVLALSPYARDKNLPSVWRI
jgi:hypothetical protein